MNVSEAPTFDRNVMSIHDSRKDTNKDEESSVTRCEIDLLIRETGSTKFGEVQHLVSTSLGRCINFSERRVISDSLRASYCAAAERKRLELDEGHRGILILTAYSTDYTIGKLCDTINKQYADKHGYQYLSKTLSYDEMMQAIGPDKKHCTWYKVLMLKRLLVEQAESLSKDKIQVFSRSSYATFFNSSSLDPFKMEHC